MTWGFALGGALLGLVLAFGAAEFLGLLLGGTAGFLLAKGIQLGQRVEDLEYHQRTLAVPAPPREPAVTPVPPTREPVAPARETTAGARPAWQPAAPEKPAWEPASAHAIPAPQRQPRPVAEAVDEATGSLDLAFRFIRQWLTTSNVPVKVGVIVLFFGVAFLLKYAVERRLLVFPIEFRLLSVAAAAAVMLAIGWRLRVRARVYALSLRGGGLGMLYLTTFAAFRLYELVPPGTRQAALLAALPGSFPTHRQPRTSPIYLQRIGALDSFSAKYCRATLYLSSRMVEVYCWQQCIRSRTVLG